MSNRTILSFSEIAKKENTISDDNVVKVVDIKINEDYKKMNGLNYIPVIENSETCPLYNLSFKELLNEISKSFIKALEFEKINSMHSSTLGFYSQTLYIPENMKKVSYDFCNQFFYVIKNSTRESLVYETIASAVNQCTKDWFSIPLVREETIRLLVTPIDTFRDIKQEEYVDIKIWTLNFTPDEIKYMRFSFIREVGIQFKEDSLDLFKEAEVIFYVNKEALESYPYKRVSN